MGTRARAACVVAMFVVVACGSAGSDPEPVPVPVPDGGPDASLDVSSPIDARSDAPVDAPLDVRDASDSGPDGGLPATVTPGAADRILLLGTVVTPDISFEGQVLVEGSLITCVAPALGCQGQVGAVGATIIDTHGVIAPGLIDTHNHILFDIFDGTDWLPAQVYANHKEWPNELR